VGKAEDPRTGSYAGGRKIAPIKDFLKTESSAIAGDPRNFTIKQTRNRYKVNMPDWLTFSRYKENNDKDLVLTKKYLY